MSEAVMHLNDSSESEAVGVRDCLERIREEAGKLPAPVLRPRAFFLADSGVITLAFEGFPRSLVRLKERLAATLPSLVPELRGSRWPKSTLAVRAKLPGLSVGETEELLDLCSVASRNLSGSAETVSFSAAKFVVYSDRALRRRILDEPVLFNSSLESDDLADPSSSVYVENVLCRSVEERSSSIRRECHDFDHYTRTVSEATLILELTDWIHPALTELIRQINVLFPGRYEWFEPGIRHITIRNLGSVSGGGT